MLLWQAQVLAGIAKVKSRFGLVQFDPEREPWRPLHSVERNGNLYPDHPMNRIMAIMNINHGDRFDYLVSMSSKSVMLNKYAGQRDFSFNRDVSY